MGFVDAGEWLEYTIDVARAGDYALNLAVGTLFFDCSIVASFAKKRAIYETAEIGVPGTGGFRTFRHTADEPVSLRSEEQVLSIAFETANPALSTIVLTPFDLVA